MTFWRSINSITVASQILIRLRHRGNEEHVYEVLYTSELSTELMNERMNA